MKIMKIKAQKLTLLEHLKIEKNNFLYFSKALFSGLVNLQSLSFSRDQIMVIESNAFENLPKSVSYDAGNDFRICCCKTGQFLANIGNKIQSSSCSLEKCSDAIDQYCTKHYINTMEWIDKSELESSSSAIISASQSTPQSSSSTDSNPTPMLSGHQTSTTSYHQHLGSSQEITPSKSTETSQPASTQTPAEPSPTDPITNSPEPTNPPEPSDPPEPEVSSSITPSSSKKPTERATTDPTNPQPTNPQPTAPESQSPEASSSISPTQPPSNAVKNHDNHAVMIEINAITIFVVGFLSVIFIAKSLE